LSFRFCRVMGRRISHLQGETSGPVPEALMLPAGPGLVLMVGGPWRDLEEHPRKYSSQLAGRLGRKGMEHIGREIR